jgi:hypothetical protein
MNENIDLTLDAEFVSEKDVNLAPLTHRQNIVISDESKEILGKVESFERRFGLYLGSSFKQRSDILYEKPREDPMEMYLGQYYKAFGNIPREALERDPYIRFCFGGCGHFCDRCGVDITFWNRGTNTLCDPCEVQLKQELENIQKNDFF